MTCIKLPCDWASLSLFKLVFYSIDGANVVAQEEVFGPRDWLPRTILCMISKKQRVNVDVLSVVNSDSGVDISGILRDTCGEAAEDLHDLLKSTIYDRDVEGGGEF